MLEIIDLVDVVAVFVDVDRAVEIQPLFGAVVCVDFVALHLARAGASESEIVIAEFEIAGDAERVDRAGGQAEERGVLIDLGKLARRVAAGDRIPLAMMEPLGWRVQLEGNT